MMQLTTNDAAVPCSALAVSSLVALHLPSGAHIAMIDQPLPGQFARLNNVNAHAWVPPSAKCFVGRCYWSCEAAAGCNFPQGACG